MNKQKNKHLFLSHHKIQIINHIVMQQFTETGLISLIKEASKRSVSILEWEQSYKAFASAVFAANAEPEKLVVHNSLCYAKAEFAFWRTQNSLKKK